MYRGRRRSAILILALAPGCAKEPDPRPQYVIVVDTTAPLVGQLASDGELSADASVDTLDVEILDAQNQLVDRQTIVRPDSRDWPVSFGIVTDQPVRLRLQAYRGLFSSHAGGESFPLAETSIARAVELPAPTEFQRVLVVLDASCRGSAPSFLGSITTCVDAEHPTAPATFGVSRVESTPATRAGTWAPAHSVPCKQTPPADSQCIPGGFFVLGDTSVVDLTGEPESLTPLRPVTLSPFFIDTREVTVGRFRALAQAGKVTGSEPVLKDSDPDSVFSFCSWLGATDPANDALPLNCIQWEDAAKTCELLGGRLPTEAEWEYAARGRGQRRLFSWGDSASCCASSIGRGSNDPTSEPDCVGVGLQEVGSHLPSPACGGLGDVTRDGVLDMTGSLREYTLDAFVPYSEGCWQAARILVDPRCPGAANYQNASRGGSWNASLSASRLPIRTRNYSAIPTGGFRCAYDDA